MPFALRFTRGGRHALPRWHSTPSKSASALIVAKNAKHIIALTTQIDLLGVRVTYVRSRAGQNRPKPALSDTKSPIRSATAGHPFPPFARIWVAIGLQEAAQVPLLVRPIFVTSPRLPTDSIREGACRGPRRTRDPQSASSQANTLAHMDGFTLNTVKQCVGFLYLERFAERGAEYDKKPVGTCFFVAGKASKSAYLVTARHVHEDLMSTDRDIFVRVNKPLIGVSYVPLPKEGWRFHDDSRIDVAALRWYPSVAAMKVAAGTTIAALPLDVISHARDYAYAIDKNWPPDEAEEVFLVGLLLVHQGDEHNFPVVRMGHVALNSDEPIDLGRGPSHYRLIESQSYKGNSGAPVWAYFNRERHCFLGILSRSFPAESEVVGADRYLNYGISAVVPGEYVVELLNLMEEERQASSQDRK